MLRRSSGQAHCIAAVILAFAVIGPIATPLALARIIVNTIDPVAVVTDHGRHLVVTGPIECTPGERAYIRVTVTQRVSGALAEGNTLLVCDGKPQQWRIDAATQGRERFRPGDAIAVASVRTAAPRDITDAHQWLVEIVLIDD